MIRNPFRRITQYLTFTRSERNGTIVLILLLVIVIVAPVAVRYFEKRSGKKIDVDHSQIDDFFSDLTVAEKVRYVKSPKMSIVDEEVEKHKNTKQTFAFDPNTVSEDSLMLLGLSAKQAAVVCNFRNRGGVFRNPSDFAKIYSIDSTTHRRLLPYIAIDSARLHKAISFKSADLYASLVVELNSADTLALRQLRGVGTAYARRIIAHRNMLGGFYSTLQLLDIYGFTKELYDKILPNVAVNASLISLININTATYEELREHPYISNYEAKAIIYYRGRMGVYAHPDEIAKNKLMPADRYARLAPYLVVK